jgi:hypothetical protein
MPLILTRILFAGVLAAAAVYIGLSAESLPASVASHFAGSGHADGYMPRDAYVLTMIGVAVGMPLAIVLLQALLSRRAGGLKVPHPAHWLAPERRSATLAYIDAQVTRLAGLVAILVAFIHGLIVEANAMPSPRLDTTLFYPALGVFVVAVVAWAIAFHLRFRRIP